MNFCSSGLIIVSGIRTAPYNLMLGRPYLRGTNSVELDGKLLTFVTSFLLISKIASSQFERTCYAPTGQQGGSCQSYEVVIMLVRHKLNDKKRLDPFPTKPKKGYTYPTFPFVGRIERQF
jgi:hypothetical protein